jgi:putative intracellular protease/amidase
MNTAGIEFEVISSDYTIFDEVTYQANVIDRVIADVDPQEMIDKFDGVMIVSGNMADTEAYWTHPRVLEYVRRAHELDKPIAAICCSVPTIREAARDKRVSFFPLVRSRQILTQAGAILTTVAATVDGKLVTAEHQMASQIWAEAFSDIMWGRPHDIVLVDSGYTPKGRERKPIPEVERIRLALERKRLREDEEALLVDEAMDD